MQVLEQQVHEIYLKKKSRSMRWTFIRLIRPGRPARGKASPELVPARSRTTAGQPQRASSRLAANRSSIRVSKRGQHRLIRELDFVNPDVPVGEDVVAAYVSTYKEPLPGKAVKALRSATKLDCKPIAAALKAVAAGGGASAGEP
ncbi:uncharacterized protein LOC120642908 [Panicum virgatum]|nr:uncharacterized protein LOC120642908 [Panicum virgatum]